MSFANKVVIVTGASSGIGAAAAIAFAKEGANVVIVGRKQQKLEKVREQCAQTGNEPLLVNADISYEEEAKRVVDETIKKFDKLDILVNNAGIAANSTIFDENILETFDSIMKTNLRAPIYMTHLAAPHLVKTKGNVINISSVGAKMTSPTLLCYGTLKAGLDHFTRLAAVDLAPHGVRVNTISPGPVKTDLLVNSGIDNINLDSIANVMPLGRVSESEEIADLILFVASDKAKAITGVDYVSDNGVLLA